VNTTFPEPLAVALCLASNSHSGRKRAHKDVCCKTYLDQKPRLMSSSADMAEQQQWRNGSSSLWVVLLRSRLLVLLFSMFVYSLGEMLCISVHRRAARANKACHLLAVHNSIRTGWCTCKHQQELITRLSFSRLHALL
jgi:hypothetical protein